MTRRTRQRLWMEVLEARDVPAAFGELDPTFGTGGLVQTGLPSGGGFGHASVAVDPFGRTVLLGTSGTALVVGRLNPDGSPDTTFGSGGTAAVEFGQYTTPAGVAVDVAGNIVALGQTNRGSGTDFVASLAIARLTAAGALDPTFGPGGKVVVDPPAGGHILNAGGVAIDAAGRVLAVGGFQPDAGQTAMAVVRLTHDGRPDPAFHGGTVDLLAGTPGAAAGVAVDPAGRVVVAGFAWWIGTVAVARLNPDGSPDPTFAGTGVATITNPIHSAAAVAVDAAGAVYVAGLGGSQPDPPGVFTFTAPAVLKLTAAGTPDPTFGTGGVFTTAPVGEWMGMQEMSLAVLSDDRVVVGETVGAEGTDPDRAGVFLLSAAGQLDPTFNPDGPTPGMNVFSFGDGSAYSRATDLDVTPTGDIIVAGFTGYGGLAADMAAARLVGPGGGRVEPYGGVRGSESDLLATPPSQPADPFASLGVDVRTAKGDVDGDGFTDTIFVTGPGTPLRVAVVSGKDNTTLLVEPFDPFGGDFTGGGFVAAGDFDHDGRAEIVVTADAGGGPRVGIFSVNPDGTPATRANFLGIDDPNFRGGCRAAVGDVNGDGVPDLAVAAGTGGGPRVALFDGKTVLGGSPARLVSDFFAFPGTDAVNLRAGATVAAGDVDGDGKADLIFGGGPGGAPRVFILSGAAIAAGGVAAAQADPVANFFVAGDETDRGGVRVAAVDPDADGRADVAVRVVAPPVPQPVQLYPGAEFPCQAEPAPAPSPDPSAAAALADGISVG